MISEIGLYDRFLREQAQQSSSDSLVLLMVIVVVVAVVLVVLISRGGLDETTRHVKKEQRDQRRKDRERRKRLWPDEARKEPGRWTAGPARWVGVFLAALSGWTASQPAGCTTQISDEQLGVKLFVSVFWGIVAMGVLALINRARK